MVKPVRAGGIEKMLAHKFDMPFTKGHIQAARMPCLIEHFTFGIARCTPLIRAVIDLELAGAKARPHEHEQRED